VQGASVRPTLVGLLRAASDAHDPGPYRPASREIERCFALLSELSLARARRAAHGYRYMVTA